MVRVRGAPVERIDTAGPEGRLVLDDGVRTPAAAGYAMPAEWAPHAACLMSWPTRAELWGGRLLEAKADYAAVARAIVEWEPLLMVAPPGAAAEVRDRCGAAVEVVEFPIDDSWARDNGPIFVKDGQGRVAAVSFRFNAWGERWHPYEDDALLPVRMASHLGVPLFSAPFVLEGGAILVDGQGTLLTTEQCLLNPNRNPSMSREQIAQGLRDYLGVSTIVWLPFGHTLDVGPEGTDGHVDGVASVTAPGRILLEAPSDPSASEYGTGRANLATLQDTVDARGRTLSITQLDPPADAPISYANFYIANGAIIVPTVGDARDDRMLETIGRSFPDRTVVGVPGEVLAFGGGGPHCITQQVPAPGITS
jgi:agmatine deiminase